MGPQSDTAARTIGRIAWRSHGVVTRAELLAAGLSAKQVRRRVESGLLLREHRGVYRVGHRAPSTEATFMAAVKACGPGAALGGMAAAHLLELVRGRPPRPEVTAPGRPRVRGVRTRYGRPDRTLWRGIPVTTVPWTLVDLAGRMDEEELARAFHQADVRHHTTPGQVDAALKRRPQAKGAGKLRRVLHGDARVTLSKLESRFLSLLREARLPEPETNRPGERPPRRRPLARPPRDC
jgi:hypothetical protein